jgi:serine/threonine protein phosphatase PrpC
VSAFGPIAYRAAGLSDPGPARSSNEDAYLERSDLGLWAVADGLGGHADGALASRMVVEDLDRIRATGDPRSLLAAVEASLAATHARLLARAQDAELSASTVVVLLVAERHWAMLWAGDSRGYRWRGGKLEQLTHDHSHVQELVDRGLLAPAAARAHPYANRITRAIGVGETLSIETATGSAEPGDVFLLCTDGLSGVVEEPAMAAELHRPPADATARLLALALEAGSTDNITAVVVALEPADPPTLRPQRRPDGRGGNLELES